MSGVIALMLARNPSLTASAAYQVPRDTSAGGVEEGARRVDACAALTGLMHQGGCAPDQPAVADSHTW